MKFYLEKTKKINAIKLDIPWSDLGSWKEISKMYLKNKAKYFKKNLIRKKIGFKNLIISDDISMKALKYSIKENTTRSFAAGCNLILHCNANYAEMRAVAENSPLVNNFIIKKTSQFYSFLS